MRAYENGFGEAGPSAMLKLTDEANWCLRSTPRSPRCSRRSPLPVAAPGSTWARLTMLSEQLAKFQAAERAVLDLPYIKEGSGDPTTPDQFAQDRDGIRRAVREDGRGADAGRPHHQRSDPGAKVENLPKLVDDEAKRASATTRSRASRTCVASSRPVGGGLLAKVADAAKGAGDKAKDVPPIPRTSSRPRWRRCPCRSRTWSRTSTPQRRYRCRAIRSAGSGDLEPSYKGRSRSRAAGGLQQGSPGPAYEIRYEAYELAKGAHRQGRQPRRPRRPARFPSSVS